MNIATSHPAQLEAVDELLMDVAARIQLSATKHQQAEDHFLALCQYVDREGSPLEDKVLECYPSGSFATGTVVASKVSRDQHDVDVVMELDVDPISSPEAILKTLFEAINGGNGSRYNGKVKLNSRCVTVEYDDGTHVDLMPIARLPGQPDRAGNLFHYKKPAEAYHKPINPWAFAGHFNRSVAEDTDFYKAFRRRRFLVEGMTVEKAETQPMPDHVPLEQKSARVVALQLIKRNRDIAFRGRTGRKPPSVVLAAVALEAGPIQARLVDEVLAVAGRIRNRIEQAGGQRLDVLNPAYPPDRFTDRWPEDVGAQRQFAADLNRLEVGLRKLRDADLDIDQVKAELKALFGETAAEYAVESYLDTRQFEAKSGNLRMGPRGKVLTGGTVAAAASSTPVTVARASTFQGGDPLPE